MKTFSRSAFHLPHLLRLSAVLPLFESLCIQRNGAMACVACPARPSCVCPVPDPSRLIHKTNKKVEKDRS